MNRKADAYLMAYFRPEHESDGEQVRFAVTQGNDPTQWTPLLGGEPVLVSDVGERGVRDPFLVRDRRRGRFFLLATDLRVHPDHDWARATRYGSRSIVIWESEDLMDWSPGRLAALAPDDAGNCWAPKAFWSERRQTWVVIWASARYDTDDRTAGAHQRLLAADTDDFVRFGPTRVYLDPGHDVIDATFLEHEGAWYRFSANAHAPGNPPGIGHHIYEERGVDLDDPAFTPLAIDVGKPELERGEGPAVFWDGDDAWYLLIDEHGLRGYQLFETRELASGEWAHRPEAALPPGARHGSVLPITATEQAALLEHWGPR